MATKRAAQTPPTPIPTPPPARSDATRQTILNLLGTKPMHVGALVAQMSISQPGVSQHLRNLKADGLITERREGRFRVYSAIADAATLKSARTGASRLARDGDAAPTRDRVDQIMDAWQLDWPAQDRDSLGISARLTMISVLIDKLWSRSSARFKVGRNEMWLLATLERMGPPHESTLTELAKGSLLSLPGLAKQLERAAEKKLIMRLPNRSDGRSNLLRLTDKGRKLVHLVLEQERSHEMAVLFQLSDNEREEIAKMTRKLLRKLQAAFDSGAR